MEMTKLSCEKFLAELASKAPTPGGGGTAALVGAAGVALGNMVGNLTTGKKKYAAVEADIQALNTSAAGCGLRPAQGHTRAGCTQSRRAGKGAGCRLCRAT